MKVNWPLEGICAKRLKKEVHPFLLNRSYFFGSFGMDLPKPKKGAAVLGERSTNVGVAPPKGGKTVEETYKKLSQHQHILSRPDSYVGSVQRITQPMWVLDGETNTMVNRPTAFVPALFKLFDEILVNAADNKQRDKTMVRAV